MSAATEVGDRIFIGAQPSEQDLAELKQQGFRSVVNLRLPGEEDQPLSPDEEGFKVKQQGMEYLHIPVSGKSIRLEQADQVCTQMECLPHPVYVHCRKGGRAAIFALMNEAVEHGWTMDKLESRAAELGIKLDPPEASEFVRGFLKTRREAAS